MKRIAFFLVAIATVAGVFAAMVPASGQANEEAAPIYGVKLPPGYRDWSMISVARVGSIQNDLRVKLGNDVASTAHGDLREILE